MAGLYSLLVYSGILSTFFMITLAGDKAMQCEDKDSLLAEIAGNVERDPISDCVLNCTVLIYGRMLNRTQDAQTQTVRFKYSDTRDDGKYCWSTRISCNAGESLLQIYVVLPVDMSVFNGELQITSENILKPHRGQAPLPEECGLRFDIMEYFSGAKRKPAFCVKVLPQHLILGEGLRCLPFLVTFWQNQNHSPVSQGGG